MQQFDNQRHRGTEGFGLFDGQELNMVHHSKEDGILKWLDRYPSNMLLFHHRFPTSTVNVKRAAHPFSTKDYFKGVQYILVHNGSIRNADELFCDHQELGINYQSLLQDLTFNDSEALLWDFALTMEGRQKELKAHGAIAFVCMKIVKGKIERLYFGRNHNPLKLYRDKQNISLSSEGAGESIDPHVLYNYHYASNKLTKRKFEIPAYKPYKGTAYEYHGGYSGGKFRGGSTYTPGSYADRHSNDTWAAEPSLPSIYDCNCSDVGWEECNYHGEYSHENNFNGCWDEDAARADDDSAAYQNWWDSHADVNNGEAGDWIPPNIREKFRQILKKKPSRDYEYDPDTHLMLPASTKKSQSKKPFSQAIPAEVVTDVGKTGDSLEDAWNRFSQRKTAEEQYLLQKKLAPSKEQIETEYMAYLAGVKGHFEQAYWAIEDDYQRAWDGPDTEENIQYRYLLEKVLDRIQNDEEYINEDSVSSIWESIWYNNQ